MTFPSALGWYWARYIGEPNPKLPDVIEPVLVRKSSTDTIIANSSRTDWGMDLSEFEWFEPIVATTPERTTQPEEDGWYLAKEREGAAIPTLVVRNDGTLKVDDGEDFRDLGEFSWFGPLAR